MLNGYPPEYAMEHKAFDRLLPNITCDKTLFPD